MSLNNKCRVSFNIPGKTFLLGEYVALFGGPSLVAATGPNFKIHIEDGPGSSPFHPESPAGLYLKKHASFFNQFQIQFEDPYQTGGFGASTAQFIAVCGFHLKYSDIQSQKPFHFQNHSFALKMWQEYRALFQHQTLLPSGADLISQLMGGVTSFTSESGQIEKLEWPFSSIGLTFYKTPYKVNTHEHLQAIETQQLPINELRECVVRAKKALQDESFLGFIEQSKLFSKIQIEAQLLSSDTEQFLVKLEEHKDLFFARGCGALGADVMAIYGFTSDIEGFKKIASIPENLAFGTWMEVH